MKKDILVLKKITKEKSGNKVLNQFFLSVLDGETVNLIGLDGSGKKELYSVLFGEDYADSGEIWFANKRYDNKKGLPIEKSNGIFFIENNKLIIPNLSVAENLYIIEKLNYFQLSVSRKKMEKQAKLLFERFGIEISPEKKANKLNSFERCVLRLMRAYIKRAKMVVINDILDDYSFEKRGQLIDILKRFKQEGISILWFNSYPDYITEAADKVVIIRKGRNSAVFYKGEYDREKVLACLVGKENLQTQACISEPKERIIFRAEHIQNEYFDDLSFSCREGEILGMYDLRNKFSREWKRMLLGKRSYKGELFVEEKQFKAGSEYALIRNKIGVADGDQYQNMVFQELSVRENMELSVYNKITKWGCFINRRMKKYLDREVQNIYAGNISETITRNLGRGDAMQMIYHRWHLAGLKILFCFQPFLRLDAVSRKQLEEIVIQFKREGTGVVLSSANISDLLPLCDRILIIENNRIVQEADRSKFHLYF